MRVLRLCSLLIVINVMRAEEIGLTANYFRENNFDHHIQDLFDHKSENIDWEYEVYKSNQRYALEYDDRITHQLVHEHFAQGFVNIAHNETIQGDFDAIQQLLARREHIGHRLNGPPHFVAKCGNTALVWQNITFVDTECNRKVGTTVELFEYVDGMAKTKLYHSTL